MAQWNLDLEKCIQQIFIEYLLFVENCARGWGSGSSGGMPAQKAQGPELEPQYSQRKKRRKRIVLGTEDSGGKQSKGVSYQ
jgi:hypothetical protein